MIDWAKISKEILSKMGDQGALTQYLADLETDITTFNTRFKDLETTNTTQAGQIASLEKTNMNLFLRIGNKTPDNLLQGGQEPENKFTYENLLNEWSDK